MNTKILPVLNGTSENWCISALNFTSLHIHDPLTDKNKLDGGR